MKKPFETLLYSTVGVVALFVVVVVFNFLAAKVHTRVDLTADKAFTLSAGTRAILAKLDTPVKIRFYYTRNDAAMPAQLKLYAQEVEDMLDEYRQASKGMVQIQKLDPEPDSDAEDSARLDGVEGQELPNGDTIYLGLSVSMLDQKEAIPFLSPDRERLLEYDISRAITRVASDKKPVVGVMSPLQVAGNPMASAMGQQGAPPWVLYSELQRDYTVKLVDMNTAIPDDVDVLVLIHPRGITPAGEYAIDQFILRGGKLLAFLDPDAVLDAPPGGFMPQSSSSSLPALLKAWGLSFDTSQIIVDMDNIGRTERGRMPGILSLSDAYISKDDLVTADVTDLVMVFPGAFEGTPAAGLKETVLVKSSKDSAFANPMTAQMSPDEVMNSFVPVNKEFPLAIRLTGKFKTAFPDGAPKDAADDATKDDAAKKDDANAKDDAAKKDDKKPTPAPALKESAKDNTVILVGDSDMIQDQFEGEEEDSQSGGRVFEATNGNLAFAENAVEQLTGDSNLIAIRSRATRERPFTVVEKMEEAAEANYRSKIAELQNSLSDTEAKLNDLQQHRADEKSGQQFILSPEQQAELENFRKKEASVKKELRDVRRNLRSQTDSLENRIKWINIAAMPALVAAAGVALALFKRKRSAAR